MPWPDIPVPDPKDLYPPPTARELLLGILEMAQEDPNCPFHVKEAVERRVPEICASETAPNGDLYVNLVSPTAYDEVQAIHLKAATAVVSPRITARTLWLTIKTDLENFPSGT